MIDPSLCRVTKGCLVVGLWGLIPLRAAPRSPTPKRPFCILGPVGSCVGRRVRALKAYWSEREGGRAYRRYRQEPNTMRNQPVLAAG